jgi:tetratricopeptide (TPR) repeat protein
MKIALYKYLILVLLFLSVSSVLYCSDNVYTSSKEYTLKDLAKTADLKQKQAQDKNAIINRHYNKGRSYYASRQYGEAKICFEQILEIEPSYEPAKLFLQSVIIQESILQARKRIENIKMKLADIMVEYDRRVQRTDSLAVKHFLELAQKECQVGNFKVAENYYNLSYKIHPDNKERIEWFVKATYDMMTLYNELDEEHKGMEELMAALR